MPKLTTLHVGLSLALLCAPALAGPSPPPVPSPTHDIGFKFSTGKATRHYAVKLVDGTCGSTKSERGSGEDRVAVCARAAATGTQLEIDWYLREGDQTITNKSTVVLARGGTQEIDGGTAKLVVTLQ